MGVSKRPYDSAELVAKFFKDMKIIAGGEDKALDQYAAKDFSQKLLNSDTFGPE